MEGKPSVGVSAQNLHARCQLIPKKTYYYLILYYLIDILLYPNTFVIISWLLVLKIHRQLAFTKLTSESSR